LGKSEAKGGCNKPELVTFLKLNGEDATGDRAALEARTRAQVAES
jgi:hypothetical protein